MKRTLMKISKVSEVRSQYQISSVFSMSVCNVLKEQFLNTLCYVCEIWMISHLDRVTQLRVKVNILTFNSFLLIIRLIHRGKLWAYDYKITRKSHDLLHLCMESSVKSDRGEAFFS